MAIAVVQVINAESTGTGSFSVGPISTTTGNLVHIFVQFFNQSGTVGTITDTAGNTFSVAQTLYGSAYFGVGTGTANCYCYSVYANNATGNAANSYTIPYSGVAGRVNVCVVEISGQDTSSALDISNNGATPTTSGTPSLTSAATSTANQIVIGSISQEQAGVTWTQASGYTNLLGPLDTPFGTSLVGYKIVSATGAQTYNPTASGYNAGGQFNIDITTYKAATGGATTHPSSGALVGPGSTVAGTATRFRAHPSSGALTGPGAVIAGSAAHTATSHPTSGVLVGQGALVAGAATRFRVHPSSGALTGPGALVAGAANRTKFHPSSGVLTGPGSTIAGTSVHTAFVPITHATTGVLIGQGAIIVGAAQGKIWTPVTPISTTWTPATLTTTPWTPVG